MKHRTSLGTSIATYENCKGAGLPATDTLYRTTICPECHGIAQVEDDDTVATHEVRVIG